MKWKQIFEVARKTGTFTDADLKMARSWPDCAVGDKLHSMNYDKSRPSADDLYKIIYKLDTNLASMGVSFTLAVSDANYMPVCKQDYTFR